jgi:hypothetical protein
MHKERERANHQRLISEPVGKLSLVEKWKINTK